MSKKDFVPSFDKIVQMSTRFTSCVEMIPDTEQEGRERNQVTLDMGQKIPTSRLHKLLGHVNENTTRSTGKYYKWNLTGTMDQCTECAISKAKRQPISKQQISRNKKCSGRIFIDISSVKTESYGGRRYWALVLT